MHYALVDARGNEVLDGMAEVNELAGFDMAFSLPDNMNLGYAYLELIAQGLPDVWGGPSGVGGQPAIPTPKTIGMYSIAQLPGAGVPPARV